MNYSSLQSLIHQFRHCILLPKKESSHIHISETFLTISAVFSHVFISQTYHIAEPILMQNIH